jgi:hypothetical protein
LSVVLATVALVDRSIDQGQQPRNRDAAPRSFSFFFSSVPSSSPALPRGAEKERVLIAAGGEGWRRRAGEEEEGEGEDRRSERSMTGVTVVFGRMLTLVAT